MSKNKKNNKVKIKKSEIEKSPSSNSNFGNSILENYSKWREDYSELEVKNEVKIDNTEEVVKEISKNEINFTDSLINSEINEDTFTGNINKQDDIFDGLIKDFSQESTEEELEEDFEEISKETINTLPDNDVIIYDSKDNFEKDEILTETQRLRLIYGNVTPLYERRKLGRKFDKKEESKESIKEKVKEEVVDSVIVKNQDENIDEKKEELTEKVEKDFSKKFNLKEKLEKSKKEMKEVSSEELYSMSKVPKSMKLFLLITLLLGGLSIGFFGVKAFHSLNVKFPEIVKSIESKNISSYSSNIIFDGKTPNESQLKGFIENLNENGDNLDLVKKWIKEDAENLKKDSSYLSKRPIRLEKYGKIYGVFDNYKIVIDPVKLKLEKSDKVETFILIDGEEQAIGFDEYSLFPGNYTVFYNDNGVKLKNSINLFPSENNDLITVTYGADTDYEIANESIKLDVNAKDSDFTITTRDNQSIVFVNDKNTGLTVKDFNSLNGTNIKVGDDIKVVTKMPWGYNISDGVKYNGERFLTVSNSLSDPKLLDVAISKSLKLFKEDVYARGSKDETVLTVMVDEALDYAKNRIQGLVNSKRNYLGGFVSMEFDLDSFEIRPYKDTYEMYIGGHLLVQETTYDEGGKAPEIATITPTNEKIGIHFIFDNEKKDWYCNVWGFTTRYISRNNIKSIDISKDMIVR